MTKTCQACWSGIFEARTDDERPSITIIDKQEFDEMLATQKETAPGPDGIPFAFRGVRGDWDLIFHSTRTDLW